MSERYTISELIEKQGVSSFHYLLLAFCSLIYALTAMNVMLISATLPAIVAEWEVDPVTVGAFLSAGYLGMFIGAIACGVLADLIGRKKTLILTISLMSVFTALCSVAWDVFSMSLLRFLAGIGLGGSLPQPGVYLTEFVPSRHRGRFIGLVETSWVYGVLLSIAFPYLLIPLLGWRLTFLVALIPLILIPVVGFFMPESLRYLELKGRLSEGLKILRRLGITGIDVTKISRERAKRYSLTEALRSLWSQTYRRRTALLWIGWAVLVYTYHGIFIWLPTIYAKGFGLGIMKSLFWILIVTAIQIPGYYSATFLLDPVGRKPILSTYLAVAGLGSFLLGLSMNINWVLLWSGVISFFNLGAWAALYTYTPELYPTSVRGTGSGFAASIGRAAGILAPILTGYVYATWGLAQTFNVFALAHILAAIATVILGIETKGMVLEEISR
ncbi:MFS transporter [Candidatus Bathyarchaeota archaeon]|nr:MAG: MFS transporter [Candidatus Bathyarchaeota archaeon]